VISIDPPTSPADIWNYANRTLTQTKFPFWSAIITQQQGSVSVVTGTTVYVTIQPPSGETWLIDLTLSANAVNMFYIYSDFDGTTARDHAYRSALSYTGGTYLGLTRILTNTLYARLGFQNADTVSHTSVYGYSGFKLSKPLYSLIRDKLIDPPLAWKKPTTLSLPPILSGLQPYAYEFLGLDINKPNDYILGILLEENTPLAFDPITKFPVERLTVVVSADALANIISQYKAGTLDLIKAGYGKYIDMFKKAGVI
jgi:hypothetical protein